MHIFWRYASFYTKCLQMGYTWSFCIEHWVSLWLPNQYFSLYFFLSFFLSFFLTVCLYVKLSFVLSLSFFKFCIEGPSKSNSSQIGFKTAVKTEKRERNKSQRGGQSKPSQQPPSAPSIHQPKRHMILCSCDYKWRKSKEN